MPVGKSSSSGMMALYIPMQPSSKTPMMDLRRRRSSAIRFATDRAFGGSAVRESGRTWLVLSLTVPVVSQDWRPSQKNSSVKSSLHKVEYFTPALVREPLRFNMPTSPGHVPLQLATVRIGA